MSILNPIGEALAGHLRAIRIAKKSDAIRRGRLQKVNVAGAGRALTAAYEQLRNAAENTEEHLLLQNAIKRFYKQLFITRDEGLIRTSGNELAVELTLAGYLQNDTLIRKQLEAISELATQYYHAYEQLQKRRSIGTETTIKWTLDVLASQIEALLSSHARDDAFIDLAYNYFSHTIPTKSTTKTSDQGAALFVALHRALLKSDDTAIRATLLARYDVTVQQLDIYVQYNKHIDRLLAARSVDRLYQYVGKNGAPLRILRKMIEDQPNVDELLATREQFLEAYEKQINIEYQNVGRRINRAIVRSVIFLVITKFIIGIAIEIPYDYWVHGGIIWLPLIINLLFPPIYMVVLRLTHALPSYANTSALVDRIEGILYTDHSLQLRRERPERRYGHTFSVAYGVAGLLVFAGVSWLLYSLQFSLVHILIFFVFISAASFLGFRLSRLIRELEVVHSDQNGMTFIRDFLYVPFVLVGRWMSDKYSRINIITLVLDMLIELPLKTILRLMRQWAAFIDDRKDRI